MQHFVAALETGETIKPDIHDGLQAQLLADAATHSWQTGDPVTL